MFEAVVHRTYSPTMGWSDIADGHVYRDERADRS